MFCLWINLLIIQKEASSNRGELISKSPKAIFRVSASRTIPTNMAPKNVLPTSPMNTFAGDQFQKINATKEAKRGTK